MKKALLVGINRYPDPRNELKGCVNDVRQMAETLKSRYGFPGDGNLRILTDARATTKAILDGLAWLTAGASPGDSLVFHYSGHGSQVPDKNGDETTDRLDEILCPYDLDWDHPLTDDDLAAACADVPQGALLTVILDCCHSGTGLRDFALAGNSIILPASRGPRIPSIPAAPSPAGSSFAPAASPRPTPPTATASSRTRRRRTRLRCARAVPPAGSASASPAPTPSSSPPAGTTRPRPTPGSTAATTAPTRTTSAAPSANGTRDLTYRALVSATGTALSRAGFDQVPQLEGPARLLALPFSAA